MKPSAASKDANFPTTAPEFSYYLNYSGLHRYNRQGVTFAFDRAARQFHYDGAAWHEIIQHDPKSPEASEAGKRLKALANSAH